MKTMWEKLIKEIAALTDEYRGLISIARDKRAALVAVDMKRLESILKIEDEALARIQKLEAGRQAALLEIARTDDAIDSSMTMREVTENSPREIKDRLKEAHAALRRAVLEAKEAGEANEFLIKSALSAVEYHLNRIGNTEVEPAYGQKGQEVVSRQKNFDFEA